MNKAISHGFVVVTLFFGCLNVAEIVIAQEEITGGDVRGVIGQDYALTREGVAAYRKCVNSIPLGSLPMPEYEEHVNLCRQQAKATAYQIPDKRVDQVGSDAGGAVPGGGTQGAGSSDGDRGWQAEKLRKYR